MGSVDRQLSIEEGIRSAADSKGNSIVQDALDTGRYTELPAGRVVLARAYTGALEELQKTLDTRGAGVGAKYRGLLRRVQPDVLVLLGLRVMLNAVTHPDGTRLQAILREMGQAIESEAIVATLEKAAPVYLQRTLQYLDGTYTQGVHHRRRTFLAAAEHTIGGWENWAPAERDGAARLLLVSLWETGLFQWETRTIQGGPAKFLQAAPVLAEHFSDILEHARPLVRFEPMVCPPEPWTAYGAGGYLTPWLRVRAPMVAMRLCSQDQRQWVIDQLPNAPVLLNALNKAQGTPYRVNHRVLEVLQQALRIEQGILGLPAHGGSTKPVFPFPETWLKAEATAEEMETFQLWKKQTAAWFSEDERRVAKKRSIAGAASLMRRYRDEPEMYFVTYADYRGRVYFRGNVHPQSHDATKGCLEFTNPEPLGEHGLFWLKVHVASCAGYDKHDFPLRAQWTDENWPAILQWLDDPLATEPPEPETAFTFLAAALALRDALAMPNPAEYLCHIPVAMDATCSGLQHFSALFRDEVGGKYTNLMDSGGDQKQDIYKAVADVAAGCLAAARGLSPAHANQQYVTTADVAKAPVTFWDLNVQQFWEGREITRSMAKRPVMTFVYGSTLTSNMDYVSISLADEGCKPILDAEGRVLYSLTKLSVPVAKALRVGVESTVPKATAGMQYLQSIARRSAAPLRWITPVGMPVLNWAEDEHIVRVAIRAMGVNMIVMKRGTGVYSHPKATASVSPNFVHSLDAAHLCMVLDQADFNIQPIHDSFACHPCNVQKMHAVLRSTFVELYQTDPLEQLQTTPMREGLEFPTRPSQGALDIRSVQSSRFMFC